MTIECTHAENWLPGAALPLLMKMYSKTSFLLFIPFPLPRYFRVTYPFAFIHIRSQVLTFFALLFFSVYRSTGCHSLMSFDSRRMPHSRSTSRMLSAHRCIAVFSWSFSFCRTVVYTPSRPRTQGTDMYMSLSVPWIQLCEQRFLDFVFPIVF